MGDGNMREQKDGVGEVQRERAMTDILIEGAICD